MSTFQKYDKNFLLQNSGAKEGTVIYDVTEAPFVLHGIFPPKDDDSEFYRLPLEVAKKVSEGVFYEATQGAGGRVRFKTDSSYIGLKVIMGGLQRQTISRFRELQALICTAAESILNPLFPIIQRIKPNATPTTISQIPLFPIIPLISAPIVRLKRFISFWMRAQN